MSPAWPTRRRTHASGRWSCAALLADVVGICRSTFGARLAVLAKPATTADLAAAIARSLGIDAAHAA